MNFEFQKLNILIISPEPWTHIFVSKHHYATHLAEKGNKVFFLNPPGSNIKIGTTLFENVYDVHYKGFLKGLRFLPSLIQKTQFRKVYRQLEVLCKVKFDVVWSFDNSVFYDFSALPKEVLKISHIVDLNQNFQLRRAATTADYCICTTDLIKMRLGKYSNRVFKINHGFNYVSKTVQAESIIPRFNRRVKAVLVGNLAMPYLDWKVVFRTAEENKNVDFVFCGPGGENYSDEINKDHRYKKKLNELSNTYFKERVSSSEIPEILYKADILIISYKDDHHHDQANPHKMMEYLGSGKMVVATFTSEYEMLKKVGLIAMSKKNNEFPQIFNEILSDLETWNSQEKQTARRAFALDNTYDKQISRIEEQIKEVII